MTAAPGAASADIHARDARDDARSGEHERRGARGSDWVVLGVFLVGAQCAGLLGVGIGDRGPGSWYEQLEAPAFNPPNWVFAPVWTTLYLLIGIAGWLVWRHPSSPARTTALRLWLVQLVLNALWTPLFFGAEALLVALFEIVLLLVAIVLTMVAFRPIDRTATALLVPYLAWVAFATALNAGFVVLN